MTPVAWPCSGGTGEEHALTLDRGRAARLLIVPALFDEANRTRRLLVETMRRLDAAGVDTFLPDLPGCNESLAPLQTQTLAGWREAMAAAARHFGVAQVLAVRGGALATHPELTGRALAPVSGASLLRTLARAEALSRREAGQDESAEALLARGRSEGVTLAGRRLGPELVRGLEAASPPAHLAPLAIEGPPLWLRAEPGDDPAQAEALARAMAAAFA